MITLCTNMTQYYVQADGIPEFIVMMEEAQKKAMQASMSIADVKLVMMALVAVLAAQHFPHKIDNWEGLPTKSRDWQAWKVAFCLAHLKRQRQLQASGGGKPLDDAHAVNPTAAPTINRIGAALKIWCLWCQMTPQYFSSLRLPTCCSQLWSPCSRLPTRT
jgi:hypothetical protein